MWSWRGPVSARFHRRTKRTPVHRYPTRLGPPLCALHQLTIHQTTPTMGSGTFRSSCVPWERACWKTPPASFDQLLSSSWTARPRHGSFSTRRRVGEGRRARPQHDQEFDTAPPRRSCSPCCPASPPRARVDPGSSMAGTIACRDRNLAGRCGAMAMQARRSQCVRLVLSESPFPSSDQ